jgi:glycerol-3-phosphate O-acyltransferase
VRKVSRALRSHFRRVRAAVIGPDLSHRRTVIDSVLNASSVQTVVGQTAAKEGIAHDQALERARGFAWEIAADYSHNVVRSISLLLTPFWNQIFDGVRTHHFEGVKQIAPGHEIIYVPCHRSHIDYLLISYLLYTNGLVPPHIAAGVNLNLPLLGPMLRRGGAFFLRRSFRANAMYSAVFAEYVAQLFARGVALEYFVEGGRSRTGRLLEPRAGMLSMTLRGYLRESRRPVLFQPVYIGYEKLIEGRSYISELSGQAKRKESLLGLVRSFGVLREKYGKVAVSFGEPILLDALLDTVSADWRAEAAIDERPDWFARAVDVLAERILVNINRAADVNPINLLALAILSMPKHAMGESDLIAQVELCKRLLRRVPYSDRVTVTPMSGAEIVAYGEKMEVIARTPHPLGDVLASTGEQAVLLSYFRNNVLHLFATASWVACCFLNNRRLRRATVVRLGRFVYPFLKQELFLPWTEEEYAQRVEQTMDEFLAEGLLSQNREGTILRRRVGQTDEAFRLRVVGQSLTQAFERFYIAIAVLVRNGPGRLSTSELENQCHQIAQRLALIYERTAPEYFDKNLFRGFIATLKERKVVWLDPEGKLAFGDALSGIAKDSSLILSRELRHSVLKLMPMAPAAPVEPVEP